MRTGAIALQQARGTRGCGGGWFRRPIQQHSRTAGYLITEALVYIGALTALLGAGGFAMYRCIDNSLTLRQSADQITHTIHIGELWRADIRNATRNARVETSGGEQVLHLEGGGGSVDYSFTEGAVYRRVGTGPWSCVLEKVKSSSMRPEARQRVNAWCWDLELTPQSRGATKPSKVRPWFSFIAAGSRNAQDP